MPTHCSAFGCTNSSGKELCRNKGISFHKFPLADKKLLGRWLINVRRAYFKPTSYSYLCSDHFQERDFEYQPFTNRRGLKKSAVPTRFSYNLNKPSHKLKQGTSHKNQKHEIKSEDDAYEHVLISNNKKSNEIKMYTNASVEIVMNEKFYLPNQIEALMNDLPESTSSNQNNSHALGERITALKETLHTRILLRSLKKQLFNAEIKAAHAKRNYYEAKKEMLSQTFDAVDLYSDSDSETESSSQNIKTRLVDEELAAQIEEKILQEELKKVQMLAAVNEKEYHEAKSNICISGQHKLY